MQDIGLFWQLTIKTIDDLRIIGDENLALEMYIIQLSHLKGLMKIKSKINQQRHKLIIKMILLTKQKVKKI